MADDNLSRVESYQYPHAHVGHLSPAQQNALDRFKELCAQRGCYKPAGAQARTVASHDDETMLRYLRARRFGPEAAFEQFKSTEDFRRENHIQELYETIDVAEYDETRKLYPQWTGRRDKRGIPVYVFEVGHLDSKTVSAYDKSIAKRSTVAHDENKVPTKMLRLLALYENLTQFVLPLCSMIKDRPYSETPVSQSNNIVDISNVGLKQFWNLKGHMQDASQLATAHYPETLDRIFIVGAPSFFPTVWGWIKRWFDPITVSKIFILSSSNMKSTLEQYIDPENIPRKYGGKLDFAFGMLPVLEPAIERALHWQSPSTQAGRRTIPTGPVRWRESSDGSATQAVAVGTINRRPRNQVIATLRTDDNNMTPATHVTISSATLTPSYPLEPVTTPGLHTHPTEEGDLYFGAPADRPSSTPGSTPTPPHPSPRPPRAADAGMHAGGQLAAGALNRRGYGDKESTVGTATAY